MTGHISRREALQAGLLTLVLLGGCGEPQASGKGAPLQLTYWGGIERMRRTNQAITLFTRKYPTISISAQAMAWQGYWDKLATRIAGGSVPDLIQMDTRYLALYIQKGILLDISNYTSNLLSLTDFDQRLLTGNFFQQRLYGVPLGGHFVSLIYDHTLLEQAGIEPPAAALTWDRFATYTRQLTRALKGKVFGTNDPSGSIPIFEMFIRQRGKEMFTETGSLNLEAQDLIDWWSYWEELRRSGGCISADAQLAFSRAYDPGQSALIAGQVAIDFVSTNFLESLQKLTKHTLALAIPPLGQHPGLYFKATMLLSGAARTAHPEDVVRFLNFVIHDTETARVLGMDRGLPGTQQARDALFPTMNAVQRKALDYIRQVANPPHSTPKSLLDPPAAGEIEQILQRMADGVKFHMQSIPEAADRFLRESEKAIKDKAS
uniref:Sugar ABC transporter substrate-binding protein n=1 Tax=Thermosporothrix sp. COM3 TaxID=2490863 RepID=A0A455SLF5_9CHLR|nr:sugar ABC transporter substrate-binding protein [Thermosporothrix sp. COM3]